MSQVSLTGGALGPALEPASPPPGTSGKRIGVALSSTKHPRAHVELGLRNPAGTVLPEQSRVVMYDFDLVKHGLLGSHGLASFSVRYSVAQNLHRELARSGGALERLGLQELLQGFPPPYHMRNMLSMENRAVRAGQLLEYFRKLLLTTPAVWLEGAVCTALKVDPSIATALWVVVRQSQEHPEPEPEPEPEPTAIQSGGAVGHATRDIPGRFASWWHNDPRSEDWDPMLKAMGMSWVVRQIGRSLSPDIEIFFTETHFNVYGKTFLGANTDSFPLNGEEETKLLAIPGQREKRKFSYKYWSDGELLCTWTYQWTADRTRRRCLTYSERRLETGRGQQPDYSSFHERVRYEQLDQPNAEQIVTNRYMCRDEIAQNGSLRPVRGIPPALQSRVWMQGSASDPTDVAAAVVPDGLRQRKAAGAATSGSGGPASPVAADDASGGGGRAAAAAAAIPIPASDVSVDTGPPRNLIQRFVHQLFNSGLSGGPGGGGLPVSIEPEDVSVLDGPFSWSADNADDKSCAQPQPPRPPPPAAQARATGVYAGWRDMRSEVERMIDESGGERYESVGELMQAVWAQRALLFNKYGGLLLVVLMAGVWLANAALHALLFGFQPTPDFKYV